MTFSLAPSGSPDAFVLNAGEIFAHTSLGGGLRPGVWARKPPPLPKPPRSAPPTDRPPWIRRMWGGLLDP